MPEYKTLPNALQLRGDIGNAGHNPLLKRITKELDKYHAARIGRNRDRQLRCLIEIYFCTNEWLGRSGTKKLRLRRTPYIEALFRITVKKLAKYLGCGENTNMLPEKLEYHFGKKIYAPAWVADLGIETPQDLDVTETIAQGFLKDADISTAAAHFLSAEEQSMYRLSFRNGMAYMKDWFNGTDNLTLVPANSEMAQNKSVMTPGFAGYVMRMDRKVYMARHEEAHEDIVKVAHSTYTAGQAVLCAGEIAIKDGRVLGVTTGSGHYRPKPPQLLHVLEHFRTYGISLRDMMVMVRWPDTGDADWYRAPDFMSARARRERLQSVTQNAVIQFLRTVPGWWEAVEW